MTTATTLAFPLDQPKPQYPRFNLERDQLLLIRRGGDDPEAIKKAHARARRLSRRMPAPKNFDSVKAVRKWRSGEAK